MQVVSGDHQEVVWTSGIRRADSFVSSALTEFLNMARPTPVHAIAAE